MEAYSISDDMLDCMHQCALYLSEHGPEDEGYKVASQNLATYYKLITEANRVEDERFHQEEQRRIDEADRIRKADLEERKQDLEERRVLIEEARANNEVEAVDKDIDQRNRRDKQQLYLEIAGLGLSLVGLCIGCCRMSKAFNVNLESYVANKEAVNESLRFIDHFWPRS